MTLNIKSSFSNVYKYAAKYSEFIHKLSTDDDLQVAIELPIDNINDWHTAVKFSTL